MFLGWKPTFQNHGKVEDSVGDIVEVTLWHKGTCSSSVQQSQEP